MNLLNGSKRSRNKSNSRRPSNRNKQKFSIPNKDLKFRGNAAQTQGRYETLARDASSAGDRVASENFLQHAEHYIRLNNKSDRNILESKENSNLDQKKTE